MQPDGTHVTGFEPRGCIPDASSVGIRGMNKHIRSCSSCMSRQLGTRY